MLVFLDVWYMCRLGVKYEEGTGGGEDGPTLKNRPKKKSQEHYN